MAGGQQINAGQGTILGGPSQPISGSEAASAVGTGAAAALVKLASRKVGGGTATFQLAGQASSAAAGTIIGGPGQILVGSGASGAQGAMAKTRARALTGSSATAAAGSMTTGPTWTANIPNVTFTQGQTSSYDLTQYTQGFNSSLHQFQLIQGALPTGVSLVDTSGYSYNGTSPNASATGLVVRIADRATSAADADWVRRSTAAGVFRTHTFNTTASLGGGFGAEFGNITQGSNPAAVIDTAVKTFGTGSMRFDVTPILGGSLWWTNFSTDYSRQFGSAAGGETFFFQFRYRVSPEVAAGYGPKIFLCGTGDTAGNFVSSCTDLEIELNTFNAGTSGYLDMYNACPGSCGANSVFEFAEPFSWSGNNFDFKKQNALDNGVGLQEPQRYCLYSNNVGCIRIVDFPNTWITIQVGVTLGPLTTVGGHDWFYESNVKAWVQIGTGAERLMYDWTGGITAGSTHTSSPPCHGLCAGQTPGSGQRYGKLWLLPYNQFLTGSATSGSIWYDALIMSTQKIPAVLA